VGQIVEAFLDGTGAHGFLDSGGIFTAIDVPGAAETQAFGINDAGQIVGIFGTRTGQHGFLATPVSELPERPAWRSSVPR
jgi:probable HAF family extracellular repeat protein